MQLILSDGVKLDIVPACHKVKTNENTYEMIPIHDQYAIPGGARATTSQIVNWAHDHGARVVWA